MADATGGVATKIGLLTLDSTNEMYAGRHAAERGGVVIAAPKLDTLQKAQVDVIVYDLDHLKAFGNPLDLVVPGAARLQVAFSHNFTRGEVRKLRLRGVIPYRRLAIAIKRVAKLLRVRPTIAA
jgi:hypothetical protein